MRLFFSFLSIAYISGIFLLADSSVVFSLAPFNPYSLLHVPLYGILTVLLFFSIFPFIFFGINQKNQINQINERNRRNGINLRNRYLMVGWIALVIAVADEIHQSYIPTRNASIIDAFLDTTGIFLALYLIFRLLQRSQRVTP